jgi:hypothetical protein
MSVEETPCGACAAQADFRVALFFCQSGFCGLVLNQTVQGNEHIPLVFLPAEKPREGAEA